VESLTMIRWVGVADDGALLRRSDAGAHGSDVAFQLDEHEAFESTRT
jgi:hypothetical protein